MSKYPGQKILAIPSVRQGNGSGHLHRMLHLAAEYPRKVTLFLDRKGDLTPGPAIDLKPYEEFIRSELNLNQIKDRTWRYVLLDQRETPEPLFEKIKKMLPHTPLAALDEGGEYRQYFDYLIDTLPVLHTKEYNLFKADVNPRPLRRKLYFDCPERFEKILISFGGEDPQGLTQPTVEAVRSIPFLSQSAITVVQGPAFGDLRLPQDISILKAPENLREYLAEFDCLITSYGLTALESLAAGTPVVTVNPSRYHSRLAKKTGLKVCGTGSPDFRRLKKALENPRALLGSCSLAETELNAGTEKCISLVELVPSSSRCPGCGSDSGRIIGRFPERSFYRCQDCSLVYQQRWVPDSTVYDHDYFFEEYTRQYGKSYLDDFEHIRGMSKNRLKTIRLQIKNLSNPTLLDVGCAYGPFLQAAMDDGFQVEGVEPAKEAALWAHNHLRCKVHSMGLDEFSRANSNRSWDVVSLWYVLEHFADLDATLRQLSRLVKTGGLLAVGTPNAAGISARRSLKKFLSASPGDHHTILSPSSIKKLFLRHGFRVEKIRVPVLHRDRFPLILRILWPLTRILSRLFVMGDTFEVYARRRDHGAAHNKRKQEGSL